MWHPCVKGQACLLFRCTDAYSMPALHIGCASSSPDYGEAIGSGWLGICCMLDSQMRLTFQKSLPLAWYSAIVFAVHPITSSIVKTSRKRGLPMSLSLNAGNHLQEMLADK